MNRIYCAIGKIVELTQTIELELGEVCEKSEIIKKKPVAYYCALHYLHDNIKWSFCLRCTE